MISTRHKFLFVHIPKTAGNSIRLALEPFCDDELTFNEKQTAYNERHGGAAHRFDIKSPISNAGKHARLYQLHDSWSTEQSGDWDSYVKIATVRNPWDRMISYYFSPHFERTEFDEDDFLAFIEKMVDRNQAGFVLINEKMAIDRILRFETLTTDFAHLCQDLGISAALPHVNASTRRDYRTYYSARSRDKVATLYKRDIDLFGYSFD